MADPKEETFLDDPEALEAELEAALEHDEQEEVSAEELELDALRAERDELKDRLLRTLAESENVRKRADRDRREAEHYGSTRLARDLLPVYDNLQRALEAANKEENEVAAAVIEGVELTLRELLNVFSKHGVTPVVPETGDVFNPNEHEAMFEAPVPGTKAGEIIQVMAVGFLLHDRLLRPAQVGVSSTPAS
ncbi:nucleotide exchange factor GrpE [Nioella sp. MMSF_3534]|jgi:molecular chaperone GrpE|uniref:nucleotide exchange factor GrpE n=1 Tax=Nioella sp. MMSF_3534 TaxID=3046720 RepID=UPI00273ED49E|nr:nucleotide exchange factor GrpE [Nioella sp. MMSF_3534]